MNIHQNRKATKVEKQLPGCLGIMVNLFDVSAGLTGNKLLTDKPHHDGSAISRSLSDVAVMVDLLNRDQVEDKQTMSDLQRSSSNKKSNVTPIKMLIAQEMSKEADVHQSPPNLVAKLMGLEAIPMQLPKSITQRSQLKSLQQSRSLSHSGRRADYSHHGRSFSDDRMQHQFDEYREYSDYKDVYDIWQQSQKSSLKKEKLPGKGRRLDTVNEKKMALVREKFMEAKRLAPDQKLRQSKEFQDAVEVLSSNRDLFLKFLQEPNSLFSKPMHEFHSIPSPPETKRITILKPTKMVDDDKLSAMWKKSENLAKMPSQVAQGTGWDRTISGYTSPYACQEVDDYSSQPTRIVVLKPGHGKNHGIKSPVPPPSVSPGTLHGDNFFEEDEDDEIEETREVAKEITRQMRENLTGHRRDETLVSSVYSNGYIGDDSSLNRSENEYLDGNLSDSEVVSPTSRHSWDFINRIGSPCSASSFSRASYSPESSVCREAKKRLSERWALMASNLNSIEQRHARKSSSTLGEMLALSDAKKSVAQEENGDSNKDQESARPSSSLTNSLNNEEARVDSPKNLSRSKSVPVSSTVYDNRPNVQVAEPDSSKSGELPQKVAGKSSKWKVSSLFFSRSRKSSKDKTCQSRDESQSATAETPCTSECPHEKAGPATSNFAGGNLNENHEQPSPVSVLDRSFEQDEKITSEISGKQVSFQLLKSNLIDKSPPIGSLARTLSWDESYSETGSPYSLRTRTTHLGLEEEEEDEQDWLLFVRTLLSAAGFEGDDPSDSSILNWHSPESPLDPSLREKYASLDDKVPLPEARRRQRRSSRKLAFDCVNAAVVEMITGSGGAQEGPISAERVWAQMKGWFTKGAGEEGGGDSLVVESVVRNEVVGRWWVENLRVEVDKLGLEIEGKLLHELVDEAVSDLSSGTAFSL
ncbi:hypothetical protein CDL15_Pgr009979 [Punica granatum]|uniref:Uncharacterized protein n=1 Tax=Punica granatum TaxID=22663 RepID=A0A218X673_PUNGR|nr:hypothetical protein CDL15_Pgr009979 [Punica granatum]